MFAASVLCGHTCRALLSHIRCSLPPIPFLSRCGHCKKLAPKYTEAAGVLAKHDGIRLAKVDATVHSARADELGVKGFPSVKVFLDGAFHEDYKQAREAEAIVKYMRDLATKVSPAGAAAAAATAAAAAAAAAKKEEKQTPEALDSTVPTPLDPCFDADYVVENYAKCCASGGVRLPGHTVSARHGMASGSFHLLSASAGGSVVATAWWLLTIQPSHTHAG
jgi:thiol-disulfide isomerase/thioredoxin